MQHDPFALVSGARNQLKQPRNSRKQLKPGVHAADIKLPEEWHAQVGDAIRRGSRSIRGNKRTGKPRQLRATSGPNQEPRSQNVELIGCQSARQWLSFLGLRMLSVRSRRCEPLTVWYP